MTHVQKVARLERRVDTAERRVAKLMSLLPAGGSFDFAGWRRDLQRETARRDTLASELAALQAITPCAWKICGLCDAPGAAGEFWVQGTRRTMVLCPEHAARLRPATRPEGVER